MEPNKLDIDLNSTTVIYKMHGTIDPTGSKWDNFVITEEDYVEFLSRMMNGSAVPSQFCQYFSERSFLFLGYSLRDWNLRVVLNNLGKYLSRHAAGHGEEGPPPSWAIQQNPSEVDRRLWEKRNVSIFDVALTDFVTKLTQRMNT